MKINLTKEIMKIFEGNPHNYKSISDIRCIKNFITFGLGNGMLKLLDLDYINDNYEYGKKFTREVIDNII